MNQAIVADGTSIDVPCGIWQIDPAHSVVGFSVRHLMSKVRGTFDDFTGQITIDEDRVESSVRVEIAMASVNTGNEMRDNDLRSSNFFGIEQHPVMTYVSTALNESGGSWTLDGDLTIRGITRSVRIAVAFLGYEPTGLQGEPRIGIEGTTLINRSDFGVDFGLADSGKVVVGDKIDISLEIEAFLTDTAGEH
ncbi:YceI family protein [Glycomyces sp. TRM65418]|uniref:YceI family protein n=1 Tax=Glycomyces sp. TRM65418 TaxID=2867006 RepID=UPI001CE60AAB|nr:YceI family protein [Glycomyces sp. TRM65418]MCC3761930.1 YceI family protein [Glycomyces sp. TRM65418]QZD56010.1 YceI family protein [Glycomyces sp. TRM65418]